MRSIAITEAFRAAEVLCRTVATKDLDGVPIYFVASDDVGGPQGERCPGALAWTGVFFDCELKRYLTKRGEWRGRGFAAAFNADAIAGSLPRPSEAHFRRAVLAYSLHELAHWLPDCSQFLPAGEIPAKFQALLEQPGTCKAVQPKLSAQPLWHRHGPAFIRAALHLVYRSIDALYFISPEELVVAGIPYGLSSPRCYVDALGDEVRDLSDLPLAEIISSPVPPAFNQLWLNDTGETP